MPMLPELLRIFPVFLTCIILVELSDSCVTHAAEPIHLYVAPQGNDTNPGTEQQPLRTLQGARDRIRKQNSKEQSPVIIQFAAGKYRFTEPVLFTQVDSGTESAPIIYRAAPQTEVHWTGGVNVKDWSSVSNDDVLRRFVPEARGKILVSDLAAQGIEDLGELRVRGFAMGSPAAEAELFADDNPMTLARWPNTGFRGLAGRSSLTELTLDTDRLNRWTEESDPWIFAYWHNDWAEIYEPIRGIDATQKKIVRDSEIEPRYGITASRARWYALNLLSEIDQAGEYYIDREHQKIYFWPPDAGAKTTLSVADGILRAENLSHVTFEGFTIEACRGTALSFSGGTSTHVVGCTVRNTGLRAIMFNGGTSHEIFGCDIYGTGEGGVAMTGGDRKSLTPGNHNVENNHIHHYSRRARTYKTGITVRGVGNRMAHNLVHHGPHMALSAPGNEHIVEFNEIHNAVYESGDAGAYYVGRDWTQRGTILRYNYWHHIVGATGHGGMTIYLDDQHSGNTIHGNLFERCSRAVFIGGGCDNLVTNNLFLDCWQAAHIDNRGMGWQKEATDDPEGTLRKNLREMPYQQDPWASRYPHLVDILEDDPGVPKRNVFRSNISVGGSWDDIHDGTRHHQTIENNLIREEDFVHVERDESGKPLDVHFADPEQVKAMGFEPLPLKKMGLYNDPRRATWPVTRTIDPISLPGDGK